MASLNEISQLVYDQVFPLPRGKNSIDIEDFKAAARIEYAAAMWIYRQEQISSDGYFQMPSDLLTEIELPVNNNEIDLSELQYLSALPNDLWLQNLGGVNCDCKYLKTTFNLAQILCDDDSADSGTHYYYIIGKKIKFIKKPHANKLPLTYANNGDGVSDDVEVNEYVGVKVKDKLIAIYGRKLPVDITQDQNPNQ